MRVGGEEGRVEKEGCRGGPGEGGMAGELACDC